LIYQIIYKAYTIGLRLPVPVDTGEIDATPTNYQLCFQHENANDLAYWKVVVDTAEQLFNRTGGLSALTVSQLQPV